MAKIICRCLKFALSIDETEWVYMKWTTGLCTNIMSGFLASFWGKQFLQWGLLCGLSRLIFLLSVCQLALVRCWKEHPRKLDVHKSIGPDGMSSKLLRELTMSLWGRSPSSLNSHCMWGRFLRQVCLRHLAMKTSVFKERNSGNWTSVPGKVRR